MHDTSNFEGFCVLIGFFQKKKKRGTVNSHLRESHLHDFELGELCLDIIAHLRAHNKTINEVKERTHNFTLLVFWGYFSFSFFFFSRLQ
jgi:hypothetical protein